MSEAVIQLDILKEIHEVRRKIYAMKRGDRERLMRDAEEIAQMLNQGNLEVAKKRMVELTTLK